MDTPGVVVQRWHGVSIEQLVLDQLQVDGTSVATPTLVVSRFTSPLKLKDLWEHRVSDLLLRWRERAL